MPLPRHQCIIYDGSPAQHLQSLALTMVGKLKGNKRCLYLNSPMMVDGMRAALAGAGLDPEEAIHKGALILTSDQEHLVNGRFEADRMLDRLNTAMQQALADGYAGLWATGDISWEFGADNNSAKLFEYERRLEAFIQNNPALSGVCQYHRKTMPLRAIEIARHTHQALYVSNTHSHLNPDYRPVAV